MHHGFHGSLCISSIKVLNSHGCISSIKVLNNHRFHKIRAFHLLRSSLFQSFMTIGHILFKTILKTGLLKAGLRNVHKDLQQENFYEAQFKDQRIETWTFNKDFSNSEVKAYFTQILNRNLEDITKFKCLRHLDFSSFDNLKYLFNHSVAFNLVLLEVLHVESCKMMKEIVTEEITAPNQNETVIFPCLKTLYVRDCPNLINFCAGKQALKFPSLQLLTIRKCPNVLSFYSTSTEGVGGPSNCTSPSFFSEKVALPSLSRLVMEDFDNVVTIFSSNIVHRFLGIQKLEIRNCAALEMVYEMQGLSNTEHSANGVAQLRDLTIKDLPKLRCIWSEDPQGVAFQNLSEVFAWGCENLRHLFPPSVAQGLSQLKKLKICHCGVEEVVAVDKDEQQVMRFAFPQLRKFILLALPKLKFFYAGQHTIEWPNLEFAQSDNIEELSKVLPNTPMQSIECDTGFWDLRWM